MNRNMAIRRLWWKELRQLIPLIGLLFIVGLLLILFSLLPDAQTQQRQFVLIVILGMPSLFAAGAGALLVGQEKEVRTIDWLRSLPVPSVDVVRTKLLAAILALAVVWLVSFGLALIAGVLESSIDHNWATWVWPLYSLYLLFVGFATAWQLRSSLVSLLLVVPLAGLPLLLASMHELIADWSRFNNQDPAPWLVAIYIVLVGVGVFVWGWRAALAYMSPERSSVAASQRLANAVPTAFVVAPRSSPAPALLWQYYTQNRGLLIGLAVVPLVSSLVPLSWFAMLNGGSVDAGSLFSDLSVLIANVAIFLSLSWLGLLVFQTDTLHRRSQFLADRGVSPQLTWLTRQAFPWLILVALASFALFVFRNYLGNTIVLLQIAVIASAAAILAATQWLGQVLRSVILGAILAPLVSFLFVGYMVYAATELVAQPWAIALTLVVPLIATFGATSAWMDGRFGWRFWTWHGSLLALAVILPSLNFVYLIATYPQMSAASRAELKRIGEAPSPSMGYVSHLGAPNSLQDNVSEDLDNASPAVVGSNLDASRRQYLADIRKQLDMYPSGVLSWDNAKKIAGGAIIDRLSDPTATADERVQRYRESVGLIVELVRRQRRSLNLFDQDLADGYEMLLLEELQAPLAQLRLGDELHASAVSLLTDSAGRDAARRSALGASWLATQSRNTKLINPGQLGGYDFQSVNFQQRVTTRDLWQVSRKIGLVSEQLLQLLDAPGDAQREAARERIYALLEFNEPHNVSNAVYLQSADGPKLLYGELGMRSIPGRAWHGDWERRAELLRTTKEKDAEPGEKNTKASE